MIRYLEANKRCYALVRFGCVTIILPARIAVIHQDGTCMVRERLSKRHYLEHDNIPLEHLFPSRKAAMAYLEEASKHEGR
jgi:hypothetical protein